MKKGTLITILIIIAVVVISYFILTKQNPTVSKEVAKCIGQNSELYAQLGCPACEIQEKMFGENYKYLNPVDCFQEENRGLCSEKGIEATPTWIINGQKIRGVQKIEFLQELTGC